MKRLRYWNGMLIKNGQQLTACVAAYSMADARRVIVEHGIQDPGYTCLRDFWSDCWGIDMSGAPRDERGLWLSENLGSQKMIRQTPKATTP